MTLKPSAQGTFAKTPFAHLLLYTQSRRLSGTLAIWPDAAGERKGRGQDRVLFQDGNVVAMRPMEPADSIYVGLLRLFRRHDSPYGFYEGHNLLGTGEGLLEERVDVYTLLARGLRDHAREDVMDGVLGKVAGKPLRIRAGVPIDRLELNTKEHAFIETLRAGPATVDELIAGAELPSRDAKRLLYVLMLIRGVEASGGAGFMSISPPGDSVNPRRADSGVMRAVIADSSRKQGASPFSSANPAPDFNAPAPPAPAGLSPQDDARWIELSLAYERLDDQNHFQLLGVPQTASPQDVSSAYYALVKKFHPDRLPPRLAPLHRCAQVLFERLTEAHETLTNAKSREEYAQAVAAGGGTRASERMMRSVLESAVEFQKAEVLVKRRDYAQAMQQLRSALNKNPEEADYLALHAWLLHLMNPTEPAPFDEMLRSLDRALRANPRNERAHFYKGTILKRMKRDNEALRHFRQAVEINPRNVDAAREVRIASMRHDSKPPAGGNSGVLSRLFGKTKADD